MTTKKGSFGTISLMRENLADAPFHADDLALHLETQAGQYARQAEELRDACKGMLAGPAEPFRSRAREFDAYSEHCLDEAKKLRGIIERHAQKASRP